MRSQWLVVLLAVALTLNACGSGDAAAAAQLTDAERSQARQMFESICVTCHGPQGRGDGPGSAALDPKPRNFGDPAWQSSVTDAHIRNVITMGGAAGGKSPMMPAQPQLKGNARLLDALVDHVRALGKEPTR